MKFEEMINSARDVLTVRQVYGEPIERDGLTVIPAARIGGGGGGGGDVEGNGGGGFGMTARPVGVYVVRGGEVTWEPALDITRTATMGMVTAIVALLVLRSIVKALTGRR
ncbi:MAG TPA: sporulation protein [candidate division Zixibacteria bacterium]|nr:sporulation protein [candidate division Zixibacteria bacterium]